MPVQTQPATTTKAALYTGYTLTTLFALFMLMDAGMKFTHAAPVIEANNQLGFPIHLVPAIGVLALVCLAVYLIPATSVLGAVLFTGYLGGAIALHLRVDNPLFSHTLFPIYIALFLWGGLWPRDANLRELFPVTHPPAQLPSLKKTLWTGYALTALGALLVLFSAVMKFIYVPPAGSPPPSFPLHHFHHIAYIEIACTILYLIPRTSFSGAVLLAGYLGGATCINLRDGQSLGSSLIPAFIAVILWAGLWLRDLRLHRLLPLRS
ncbi:DoxX family protein [Edaphobacter aggregans]|uniref:DoxX family protein n=1 Tax=Edaphobacter aggregans TaxID=570835 RepID=UPI000A061F37|nr:DoxX family protein [Edaphobacter aggregans]